MQYLRNALPAVIRFQSKPTDTLLIGVILVEWIILANTVQTKVD